MSSVSLGYSLSFSFPMFITQQAEYLIIDFFILTLFYRFRFCRSSPGYPLPSSRMFAPRHPRLTTDFSTCLSNPKQRSNPQAYR